MRFLIVLIACCGLAIAGGAAVAQFGGTPDAYIELDVRDTFINKAFNFLRPKLVAAVSNFTFPGKTGDSYTYAAAPVKKFALRELQTKFQPPNRAEASIGGVDFEVGPVPFTLWKKILWTNFSCSGTYGAEILGTSLSLSFDLIRNNETGTIGFAHVVDNLHFGTLRINHEFDGFFCKLGDGILDILLLGVNDKVANFVNDWMPHLLTNSLVSSLDSFFASLHMLVHTDPMVADGVMSTVWDIAAIPSDARPAAAYVKPRNYNWLPGKDAVYERLQPLDVNTALDETSGKNLLRMLCVKKKLDFGGQTPLTTGELEAFVPGSQALCPKCTVQINMSYPNCTDPPYAEFHAAGFTVGTHRSELALYAVDRNGSAPLSITSYAVTGTFTAYNFSSWNNPTTVDFDLQGNATDIEVIDNHTGQPQDPSSIAFLLNSVAYPMFNQNFHGVAVPKTSFGFVENVTFSSRDGVWATGFDVVFADP